MRSNGRRRAFMDVPETCPALDRAAAVAVEAAKDAIDRLLSVAKDKGTELLRAALVSAYDEVERLEGRVADLEAEVDSLKQNLDDAIATAKGGA